MPEPAKPQQTKEERLAEARENLIVNCEVALDEHRGWLVYLCIECQQPWPCAEVHFAERILRGTKEKV